MPIARRDLNAKPVQVPARAPVREREGGVLYGFPSIKRAAIILYNETDPKTIPIDDLVDLVRTPDNDADVDKVYRNRIRSKATGIRAFCVLCAGGQPRRVRVCENVKCALWPFRMGSNPFRRKI